MADEEPLVGSPGQESELWLVQVLFLGLWSEFVWQLWKAL